MGQKFAKAQERFLRDNIGSVEVGLIDALPDPVARGWMRFRGYHIETDFLTNWQANIELYKGSDKIAEDFIDLSEFDPETVKG